MQETGVRNGAYGADKFGFKDLAEVHWNLTEPPLYEHAIAGRRSHDRRRRRALRRDRPPHRPLARRTSTPSSTTSPRIRCGGTATAKCRRRTSTRCWPTFIAHAKGKKLFAQDLYGGADPKYRIKVRVFTELRLALAVHPPAADPPRARRARRASSPSSPSSICRRSSRTPSVTAAATAPTPWWRSISPARSC